MERNRLYAFSGVMMAGKDYVAKSVKLNIVGFADPIYTLTEHFCGTRDKAVPGIRKFMQTIGQWGWGLVSDRYPWTPERASLTHIIRGSGSEIVKDFEWVDWSEYGRRKDFWVNILLSRMDIVHPVIGDGTPSWRMWHQSHEKMGINGHFNHAVTNARFDHEMDPLNQQGFKHFHVMCSEDTRRERMTATGYKGNADELNDTSEALALKLNVEMPRCRVVWNDHRPAPCQEFLTVKGFEKLMAV